MVDTEDTRRTIHAGRRTTPRVWHKLPTGELKIIISLLQTTGSYPRPSNGQKFSNIFEHNLSKVPQMF